VGATARRIRCGNEAALEQEAFPLMCLAIPAQITQFENDTMVTVEIMGVTRKVSIDLVPEAVVGDYVLVHAGFALQVVDEEYANETIEMLKQIPGLYEEAEVELAEGA